MLDLIIILICLLIIYLLKDDFNEYFIDNTLDVNVPEKKENIPIIKQPKKNINTNNKIIEKKMRNPHFIDLKYHTEYTDVLTAINDMAPNQKRVFNLMCMPVTELKINKREVNKLISDFIKEFNIFLNKLPDHRIASTGWDEKLFDPKIKSGWDKFRHNLGLPDSLYDTNYDNSKNVYLIDYFDVKKVGILNNLVLDEIRYTMKIILQKYNVVDQIVLSLSLVGSKNNSQIIIEEFSVIGFLTTETLYNGLNYSSFGNIDDGNFVRDSDIINELLRKDRERIKNSIIRSSMTDNFN